MEDVLLINPPLINRYKKVSAKLASMPPLGLMYIGADLKNAGYKVSLIDFAVDFLDEHKFTQVLKEKSPLIVGITTFTECYSSVKTLSKLIKNTLPSTTLIAGGSAATFEYKKILEETSIDYIIRGEGEETFRHLTECIIKGRNNIIPNIKGIVYKKENTIILNEKNNRIQQLDNLSWPDRELINTTKYLYPFTISTARGCPGNCLFCSSRQFWGKEVYTRSVDNIFKEIKYLQQEYNMKQFFIVDDTFTLNPQRAIHFAEKLINANSNLIWGCESRADVVSNWLLKKLYDAGCRKIQFGLESANNSILKKIGKNITKEQVYEAVKIAYHIGFEINVSFIIGHPFDTHDTIRETLDFAYFLFKKYNITLLNSILVPYPGTKLYDSPSLYNMKILSDDFDNYSTNMAIIETENFTANELRRYYFSFYDVIRGKDQKLFYH